MSCKLTQKDCDFLIYVIIFNDLPLNKPFVTEYPPRNARYEYGDYNGDKEAIFVCFHTVDEVHS